MSQEANLSAMEHGRKATEIRAEFGELIDNVVRTKLARLIAIYRQGKIDHDMVIGLVGEMAAMQELVSELESMERRGIVAREKELGRGQKV
jgi:hypothetical protein